MSDESRGEGDGGCLRGGKRPPFVLADAFRRFLKEIIAFGQDS